MRLALLQEKQNALYDFSPGGEELSFDAALDLRDEMLEQNFFLKETAVSRGADFLVTSEAINFPGPPERLPFPAWDLVNRGYDALVKRLAGFAATHKVWLAAGLYRPLPDGALRNSALVFNRRGETAAVYDKIHLAGSERRNVEAGDSFCVIDSEFGKIGVCVCWDMQFPETCRILALKGARLVVCPTWGWEAVYATCRAYENGVYAAGAMAVPWNAPIQGIRSPSGVINPEGVLVARAGTSGADVVVCDIDLREEWAAQRERLGGRRPGLYGKLTET